MTHALFKQIDLTAKLGQDGSSLQAMNALRVIRETVAKHLAGTEGAGEIPLKRALLALRTIAEFPCSEQDDLPAANMRQIALAALGGAGASSEPGNPGAEPVSGPGNAGGRTSPSTTQGSGDSSLAESLNTLERWLDRVAIEDGYVGVPVIEAVEVAVNELRRLRQFERICEGLPQDAIDGGWTVQGIRRYAKRLEDQLKSALARVAELEHVLRVVVNAADHGSWPTTVMHGIEKVREVLAGSAPPVKAQPEETPGEILAAKLIETWVTKHGKPAPWSTAVEITALATNMPNDERDRLLALDDDVDAQAQHSVPDGWKLVPVEPTPEMLDARRDCEDGMDGYLVEDTEYYFPDRGAVRAFLARVYQGLIAAAPAPGGER
ncbi:TPA: hypothetical protein ACIJSY_006403 [Pseudomonas aeruginosa]